jgi:uncharacterized protein (TIGR00251 family)
VHGAGFHGGTAKPKQGLLVISPDPGKHQPAILPNGVPWASMADGVVIAVRLTPRGGRDAIEGIERLSDGRAVLKARVRAAPSEGEANAALIRLIASALDVAPRAVSLVAGASARVKRVKIAGDSAELLRALKKIVK